MAVFTAVFERVNIKTDVDGQSGHSVDKQ